MPPDRPKRSETCTINYLWDGLWGYNSAAAVSAHTEQARDTIGANVAAGAAVEAVGGVSIDADAAAAFSVVSALVVARSTAPDALGDVDADPVAANVAVVGASGLSTSPKPRLQA